MSQQLDLLFYSLSDQTRRDILRRLTLKELTVSQIAKPYKISLAAVSKHLKVLEKAKLIGRRRDGKNHIIHAEPKTLIKIDSWIEFYKQYWNESFDQLNTYLTTVGDTKNET